MKKIIKERPRKYPPTNVAENDAKVILEYIICRKNVKSYLKKMDKIPNYDGYFEITEDDQTPIGKIEVQLKKLADDVLDNPKCQCDLEFLSYCELCLTPILLILVDTKNALAYWTLIDRNLLKKLRPRNGTSSLSIRARKENVIKEGNSDYLPKWVQIIQSYQARKLSYDSLESELAALKQSYSFLLDRAEATLGLEKPQFGALHKFLDFLNLELDTNFKLVKDIFFQSCWKIGIGYFDYAENAVSYVLYPISPNKNDVQIKEIPRQLRGEFMRKGLVFTVHYRENPIIARPETYALEIIRRKVNTILKNKALPVRNVVLAREVVFSFIERFSVACNVEVKEVYNLAEIRSLQQQHINCSPGLVINKDLLRLLPKVLDYLSANGISEVERLYVPKNYERLERKSSAFIWSSLSPENLGKNVQIFFGKLPLVYNSLLDDYFPSLKCHLHFFKDFDRLIAVVDAREEYRNWQDRPSIECYYLRSRGQKEKKITVYLKTDKGIPVNSSTDFDSDIRIDAEMYQLSSKSVQALDFIYEDSPMVEYIYELLNRRFNSYFGRNDSR